MKLDVKHINYPGYIAFFSVFGLGALCFFTLLFSKLCQFFFWLPLPWLLFWMTVTRNHILYDKAELLDEGVLISHSNKNWLTKRLRPLSIPWARLSQIQALWVGKGRGRGYRHFFVLDNGQLLELPYLVEGGVEGADVYEIAEAFASFLKSKLGQEVPVYRLGSYSTVRSLGNPVVIFKYERFLESGDRVVVSRLDALELPEEPRGPAFRHRLSRNIALFIVFFLLGLVVVDQLLDAGLYYPKVLFVIGLFLVLALLFQRGSDRRMNKRYLELVRKEQEEEREMDSWD